MTKRYFGFSVLLLFVFFLTDFSEAASFRIFCNVDDAKIYMENSLVGISSGNQKSPLIVSDLDEGNYRLKVVKQGFLPFTRNIKIVAGTPNSIEVILREMPTEGTIKVLFQYYEAKYSDYVVYLKASADPGGSSCYWYLGVSSKIAKEKRYGHWNGWSYRVQNNSRGCSYMRTISPGTYTLPLSFYVRKIYVGDIINRGPIKSGYQAVDIITDLRKRVRGHDDRYQYIKMLNMSGRKHKIEVFAGKTTTCFVVFNGDRVSISNEVSMGQ